MTLQQLGVVIIGLAISGCCLKGGTRKEPPYPSVNLGWNEREVRGVRLLGSFVSKPGETLENGDLQMKVIELAPSDPCVEPNSLAGADRVTLRFIRKTDQKILCESTFRAGESATLLGAQCGDVPKESDVAGVSIKAINITGGWVYFELAK
jgi:hypothetical protein